MLVVTDVDDEGSAVGGLLTGKEHPEVTLSVTLTMFTIPSDCTTGCFLSVSEIISYKYLSKCTCHVVRFSTRPLMYSSST